MALKAVIFDVDGVLVKSMERHHEAYAAAFRPFGVEIEQHEVFRNEGRGSRDVAVALNAQRKLGLTEEQLDAVAKEKQRVFASFGPMPKYPGVDEVVARLRAKRLRIGMVTGTSRVNIGNHFGPWLSNFDAIVTADDVKRTKPDPEPYLQALAKLGLPAAECVVVENAPLGIQSGKAAGLRVVAITTTNPADVLLAAGADAVVGSIREIEGVLL